MITVNCHTITRPETLVELRHVEGGTDSYPVIEVLSDDRMACFAWFPSREQLALLQQKIQDYFRAHPGAKHRRRRRPDSHRSNQKGGA